jgi:outer membrane receptor protein involved in Fe transport
MDMISHDISHFHDNQMTNNNQFSLIFVNNPNKGVIMYRFLAILFSLLLLTVSAYSATLTGKVISEENGNPLFKATVTIEETGKAVSTDENGYFQIDNVDLPATLIISYVGYTTIRSSDIKDNEEQTYILKRSLTVLDTYVVTANRYEKEAYKVSQPITSVSSQEIINKGYTLVSDVVRTFPGLDMNDAGPFRTRPVIRGLFGTRILILVDGERLNDQRDISEFAGVSMSLVDVNEIERIEVVNGPTSVLYGSDAMGGVINIITNKNKFTDTPEYFAKYNGRYSTVDEHSSNRIDVGYSTKKFNVSAGFQYREAKNDFKPPEGWNENDDLYSVFNPEFYDSLNTERNTEFTTDRLVNTKVRVNNYDLRLGYKINDNSNLVADFGIFRTSDIGYAGVPNDSTPFLFFWPRHDRDNFSLSYIGKGLTDKLARLETKFYYQKITKEFFTNFYDNIRIFAGPPPNPPIITPQTTLSTTEVTKYGLNFQELYKTSEKSTLTLGADFWREEIDGRVKELTLFEGFGPFPFVDTSFGSSVPKNTWHSLGLFTSGQFDLSSLTLILGLRYDNFWINTKETDGYLDDDDEPIPTEDESYNSLNGSIGASYQLRDEVNLVANLGTAFRVPNVVERFFYGSASGRQTRPNPDIKPEKSVSIDFGVKAVHPTVNYSIMGFWSGYNDFTQLQRFDSMATGPGSYTPLWRFENLEDVTIYGLEAVVEGNFDNGVYATLMFSYQHGNIDQEDQPLFVSPVKTTFTLGYKFKERGAFSEFTIRRAEDQNRIPNVAYLDDITTKGFTVVNVTAGLNLTDNVRITASVNNLFDEIYSEPFNARNPDNPIAEPARNLIIGLNAGF